MRHLLLIAMTALSVPALAVPVTVDITGVITRYEGWYDNLETVDHTSTLTNPYITASITFDRSLAPAPMTESGTGWNALMYTSTGLPLAEFAIGSFTWENGTLVPEMPADIPGGASVLGDRLHLTNLFNEEDGFTIGDIVSWGLGLAAYQQAIVLGFYGDFWPGADVPSGSELPDLAAMRGEFLVISRTYDDVAGAAIGGGFILNGQVTSVSTRIARQVPEPASAMLLLAGFVGLRVIRGRAAARRRR